VPLEVSRVRCDADLELGEVRLEEQHLVLAGRKRCVRCGVHDREVVEEVAGADVRARLRDELGALEDSVPGRRAVDGELQAPGLGGGRRVLVRRVNVEVLRGGLRSMDVPLVLADLVAPAPLVKVCGGLLLSMLPC
jgi:hypothetical protein